MYNTGVFSGISSSRSNERVFIQNSK